MNAKKTSKPSVKSIKVKAKSQPINKSIEKQTKKSAITRRVIAGTIIACFLLVLANSAIWVNNTLFNSTVFSNLTKQAILSESSRNAIASELVDTALADKPVLQRTIGPTASKLISGFLGTSAVESSIGKLVTKVNTLITSKDPQNIEFELTSVKATASKLIALTGNEDVDIDKVPDTLVLLDVSNLPNFYQYSIILLWLAPISIAFASFLLIKPHFSRRRVDMQILTFQGLALIGASIVALLIGPLFRPIVLGQVNTANSKIIVQNVYDTFIATFTSQTMYLFVIGSIVALIPAAIAIYKMIMAKRRKTT